MKKAIMESEYREETDSIGVRRISSNALVGIQTARALDNFNLSDVRLRDFPEIVRSLAMVKKAAALANADLGAISNLASAAVIAACDEIIDGQHHDAFAVDVIQGGAGTSTNMNANEVIANLASLKLGLPLGDYSEFTPTTQSTVRNPPTTFTPPPCGWR
ncbi:lyase family protein [Leisingera sp. M527]|uniref:lyase family protein n=1 Tax=Leisingera sp. M527 TaxID=2867014 RepID=UPI00288319F1|nr:lyase family protein [Leisingera sp. M527]